MRVESQCNCIENGNRIKYFISIKAIKCIPIFKYATSRIGFFCIFSERIETNNVKQQQQQSILPHGAVKMFLPILEVIRSMLSAPSAKIVFWLGFVVVVVVVEFPTCCCSCCWCWWLLASSVVKCYDSSTPSIYPSVRVSLKLLLLTKPPLCVHLSQTDPNTCCCCW